MILHRGKPMTNTIVGQKIRMLREQAGLSQMQIAQFLDVDQSMISKCEKGERPFQMDQLERLGNLFGISLSDLVDEEEPVTQPQIAFHADDMQVEDLNAVADIQKIALNLQQMRVLLQESRGEV